MSNPLDPLDPSKLTSLNELGEHIRIIPAEVRGFFRKHRDWSQIVLLIIFLLIPWTHINGEQSILFQIQERKFSILGFVFYAHDTPLIFFLVFGAAMTLAFVTSIWGRVWCGWACPQTVFIDAVFRRIEQWTEGNYIQRRQLRLEPLSIHKLFKVFSKWTLFIFASSLIAHSFAAYFTGSKELIHMTMGSPKENWDYFVMISVLTGILLFNFAWFREQFCTIMCPYGRIQSVLLDKNSLTVAYDEKRGEPRKGPTPSALTAQSIDEKRTTGDCVNCKRCVQVCPTGIDIRNGLQMECIACTACIDACDEIMQKVNKPLHLIGYKTLDEKPLKILKPQSIGYLLILFLCIAGLVFNISTRKSTDWTLLRAKEMPYQIYKDDNGYPLAINHFRIQIKNQSAHTGEYFISLSQGANTSLKNIELVSPINPLRLEAGKTESLHFFVKFPENILDKNGQFPIQLNIRDISISDAAMNADAFKDQKELVLIGPHQNQ